MNPEYEILDWDTNFFGIKVARGLNFIGNDGLAELIERLRGEGVRVAYFMADPLDVLKNDALHAAGAILVDEKVTYTINTQGMTPPHCNSIVEYKGDGNDKNLLRIACQAGEFSRFRVDKNFGDEACDRLYKQWIRNDASIESKSYLYVYRLEDSIIGLITVKAFDGVGSIGLIGVSSMHRGKNVGKALIDKAVTHFQQREIFNIDVVTQKANLPACGFYQKNGFGVKNVINFYHLWL